MAHTTTYASGNLIFRLFTSPSFRVVRHVVFVLAIAVVSLSQTAHVFLSQADDIGGWIYPLAISSAVAYLLVGYLHIYCLIPKFLLRKKYASYVVLSVAAVLLLACLKPLQEYFVNSSLGLEHSQRSYFGAVSILDLLSDFMLTMLCITGVSMTVMLKEWMEERNRVAELERKYISSEISAMKERINPNLLLDTLNSIGRLSRTDPDTAANMVLELSQFLRHALYGGSREKIIPHRRDDKIANNE